jgi:hypothetical protein
LEGFRSLSNVIALQSRPKTIGDERDKVYASVETGDGRFSDQKGRELLQTTYAVLLLSVVLLLRIFAVLSGLVILTKGKIPGGIQINENVMKF